MTKMTEKVAVGVLSGVLKFSGFFVGSAANSKVGKKLFGFLPGEMVLASLDGFSMSKLQNFFFSFKYHALRISCTHTNRTACSGMHKSSLYCACPNLSIKPFYICFLLSYKILMS